jgi:O-antigen/teichoic acid export membrane protein
VILWQSELLPFQWRLAVSWVCGYFATWAVAPLSVKMFDPVIGGQVGMVWSLATGVTTISTALITVKAPHFGMLVAERKFAALDRSALRVGGLSVIAAIAGCSTICIAVWILTSQQHSYAQRLLPLEPTILILVATVLLQTLQPMAAYLRAHKQEPFMPVSLALAVTSLAGIMILGRLYGPIGISYGYLMAVTCFTLPLALFIFLRCRRKWHSPLP